LALGVISIDALLAILAHHAYLLVFVGTLIDATGTPFPGRLMLITVGGLAATGDLSVVALIALAIAGAVLGDHLWYLAGRLAGGRVTRLYCRFVMFGARGCEERARAYLARFGPAAIIVGRFMAGVRIVVTPLAAESGMPYLRYAVFDVLGATLWCSLWVLVGFGLGDQWMTPEGDGKEVMLGVLGAGLILTVAMTVAVRLVGTTRAKTNLR
jgi:membrane protein DedA with SNARE-associated domain